MAWEERAGRLYYYRSIRRGPGGRVVKEYIGSGPGAELLAAAEGAAREDERRRREAEGAERERLVELDREIGETCGLIEGLARAALVDAGYRQHKRGEWRLKRVERNARESGD